MDNFLFFTLKSNGILNKLETDVLVFSSIKNTQNNIIPRMWKGLWDTGASVSSITQRIVDEMNLTPIGKTSISTANGIVVVSTYFVNIGLPNGVTVRNVLVSCADLGNDIDVLIGMDIIRHGDFSIANKNNRTTFSFRIPSMVEIDYVKESQQKSKF